MICDSEIEFSEQFIENPLNLLRLCLHLACFDNFQFDILTLPIVEIPGYYKLIHFLKEHTYDQVIYNKISQNPYFFFLGKKVKFSKFVKPDILLMTQDDEIYGKKFAYKFDFLKFYKYYDLAAYL